MARMHYVVTGGTGFIGSRIVARILETEPDAHVWVLVRRESLARFERLGAHWGERAKPLVGDLTAADLGLSDEAVAELGPVEHVVHCAAIYDITAGETEQRAANVDGTRAVIGLATKLGATLHHMSSIAVAGTHPGDYTEADFDVAQELPTPYHRTKFEAEQLVRSASGLRYRIYRPAVVVGDSRTGEMDKIDGPYYFFGVLARLAVLPKFTPIALPDSGRTNIVPVDYVVDAVVAIMRLADRDGQTFHLTAPETIGLRGIYRAVGPTAGLPPVRAGLPRAVAAPLLAASGRAKVWRNMAATQLGIPPRSSTSSTLPRPSPRTTPEKRCAEPGLRCRDSLPTRRRYGGTGRNISTRTAPAAATVPTHWAVGTSSSPEHPAGSGGRPRSRWRRVVPPYSPWPAMPRRSTTWSPRSAQRAVRRTRSPAT
jgi:thioester reductase-like protein